MNPLSLSATSAPLWLLEEGPLPEDLQGPALFARAAKRGPACLLESLGEPGEASRWTLLASDPLEEVPARLPPGTDPLAWLDAVAPEDSAVSLPGAFARCWFGAFAYEFAERLLPGSAAEGRREVDFYFFRPGSLLVADRLERRWYRFGAFPEEAPLLGDPPGPFRAWDLRPACGAERYRQRVCRALAYIAAGDVYQANLSQRFEGRFEGDPAGLYARLRAANPGPFLCLLSAPGFTVVSSSPERLVSCRGDRLETRPIAGTRPRGVTPEEDAKLRRDLLESAKERAEHLMLVDLARNDLGRVAVPGSVRVSSFAGVERYARVQHLVSVVEARRRSSAKASEVLSALFPGGTITGCPKIRCCEVIREIEGEPRGFYTGSAGYIGPGPLLDLNLLIRTLVLCPGGFLSFHVGAGIVADSDPEWERRETLHKGEALARALGTSLLNEETEET